MICINTDVLAKIGFSDSAIREMYDSLATPGSGLEISYLFSFGGAGADGRDRRALEAEAEPRTLVLVGMADRYEEGARRGATVRSMCVPPGGYVATKPTPDELSDLLELLHTVHHPVAAAIREQISDTVML